MSDRRNWKDRALAGFIPDLLLCALLSLVLEILLEVCDFRSVSLFLTFLQKNTWIFFYNCMIVFLTFIPVFLVKKKLFVYILVSGVWTAIGVTNGVMLGYRNTPFSAVDIALLKSTLPVISNYLKTWQIAAVLLLIVGLIAGTVTLFLYCPETKKKRTLKRRLLCVLIIVAAFMGITKYGLVTDRLDTQLANIRLAYRSYGTPYCFGITLFDTGIDRPFDYSVSRVENLVDQIEKKYEKLEKKEKQTPNIIFLQLESFYDVTRMKNMTFSEDPTPFLRKLRETYSSGYMSAPSYGAGTVNTEFEVITGMNKDFFGAGEYPFKSVYQEETSESACYVLKEDGYTAHAIHNNNASFYDRDYVYANVGFDTFTTIEFMNIMEITPNKWAKDKVLTKYINDALDSTPDQDYIYTVSVQGHGDYPEKPLDSNTITVNGAKSETLNHQFAYYASQIREMDRFVEDLILSLENREEDTVLVVFGDHLPSLEVEDEDLESGNKFQTEYVIWDNIGLSKEDENLQAYQLYSKVFAQLGIGNGIINKFHQTYRGKNDYSTQLKLLEYDMLYGNRFSYGKENPYLRTDMTFGVTDIEITSVNQSIKKDRVFFGGHSFTPYTTIYVNGKLIETEYQNRALIRWNGGTLKAGDEIYLIQKSKTNQHPELWKSPVYVYQEDGTLILKEK